MGSKFGFHVEWSAIPKVLRDFYAEGSTSTIARFEWGLINTRLLVPESLRDRRIFTELWWFYPDKIDEFGPVFNSVLVEEAIPVWNAALKPGGLADLLVDPGLRLRDRNQPAVGDPLRVKIVLEIDDGDPAELNQMIDQAFDRFPENELLGWLRRRLENRTQGPSSH